MAWRQAASSLSVTSGSVAPLQAPCRVVWIPGPTPESYKKSPPKRAFPNDPSNFPTVQHSKETKPAGAKAGHDLKP
jgi:hypothetical protein